MAMVNRLAIQHTKTDPMNVKKLPTALFVVLSTVLALPVCRAQPQEGPPLKGESLLRAIDSNRDGCANREEWQRSGAPMGAFDTLKDVAGCVTAAGVLKKPAPLGLDADGDGQVSLTELIAFDRKQSAASAPKR
jgi:EF hand